MRHCLDSLSTEEVLSTSLKQQIMNIGIVSIFCYSAGPLHVTAGLIPWTRSKLLQISKMWPIGYMQGWCRKAARKGDAPQMILCADDAGRAVPPLLRSGFGMSLICMTRA